MTRPLALITGGARRVGRATAVALARAGFDLALTWRARDPGRRAEAQREIEAAAAEASAAGSAAGGAVGASPAIELIEVDLADRAALEGFCAKLEQLPSLDALVHNAATWFPDAAAPSLASALERHLAVNATAPLLATRAATAALRRSVLPGGGAVVLFSDIHVLGRPRRGYTAYAMSKAAATQMVECLARELAPAVRVNAVAPGVVAWPDDAPPAERLAYEARIPLARSGKPEEAAEAVRWLVLDAGYVTGQILRVDGGRWLC
ncbi:MAG TPA: SDR family oxidoreductase [Phycisphaerales bacterium]|nr:SDR family oxidoreductase [Phycisphaerales bacterium]HMP37169.1 SDR family oxidoreductase [Phycisphaerales bacterium]